MEHELRIDFNFISSSFYDNIQRLLARGATGVYRRTKYMSTPNDLRLTIEYQTITNKYLIDKYSIKPGQKWHLRQLCTTRLDENSNSTIPSSKQYQLKVIERASFDFFVLDRDMIQVTRATSREIELDADDLTACARRIQSSGHYHAASDIAPKQILEVDQMLYFHGAERFTLSKTIHQNEKIHYSFHIEREFVSSDDLVTYDIATNASVLALSMIRRALADSTRSEVYDFINPLCIWKLYNLNHSRAFKLTNRKVQVGYISPKLDGVRSRGAVVCGKLLIPSSSPSLERLCRQFETLGVFGNYFVVIEELPTAARIIDVFGLIEARYSIYNSKVINNKHHSLSKSRKFNTYESIELMTKWGTLVCNTFYRIPNSEGGTIRSLVRDIRAAHADLKTDGLLAFGIDKHTIYKLKKNHTVEFGYTLDEHGQLHVQEPAALMYRLKFVIDPEHILKTDKLYAKFGRPLLEFELEPCRDGTILAKFIRQRFDKCIPDPGDKVNKSIKIMLTTNGDDLYPIVY